MKLGKNNISQIACHDLCSLQYMACEFVAYSSARQTCYFGSISWDRNFTASFLDGDPSDYKVWAQRLGTYFFSPGHASYSTFYNRLPLSAQICEQSPLSCQRHHASAVCLRGDGPVRGSGPGWTPVLCRRLPPGLSVPLCLQATKPIRVRRSFA